MSPSMAISQAGRLISLIYPDILGYIHIYSYYLSYSYIYIFIYKVCMNYDGNIIIRELHFAECVF